MAIVDASGIGKDNSIRQPNSVPSLMPIPPGAINVIIAKLVAKGNVSITYNLTSYSVMAVEKK